MKITELTFKSNHKTCLNENHSTDKKTTLLGRRVFFQYEDNPSKFFDNLLEKIKDVVPVIMKVTTLVLRTPPGHEKQVLVPFDNVMEKMVELERHLDIIVAGFVESGHIYDDDDFKEIMEFKNNYSEGMRLIEIVRKRASESIDLYRNCKELTDGNAKIKAGFIQLANYVFTNKETQLQIKDFYFLNT